VAKKARSRPKTRSEEESLLEELVRALCHDVGNLLAAVRLSAHVLRTDIGELERVSISRDIEDLSAHAGALLAHVRPLLAGASVARTPVSPAEILGAITRAFEDKEREGASLSVTRGRNLSDVRVDPDALYHLLLTLVRGSLEAAAPAGRVRVAARQQGRRVVLSVLDDGRAMNLEEVWSGSVPRGRELAVRVADVVVRRMGGRVSAESRRRGTRIDLWLPVAGSRSS
jgi:signal transduction histidine kinase